LLFIPLITLVGCKGNSEITTKCPLGAPSLLYYDQGNNKSFITISGAAQIIAEFQRNEYDALIVDANSGLNQIKKYNDTPYRFAKLLTYGNLYLASFKHNIQLGDRPTANQTILSFGNLISIPYQVTNKLVSSKWTGSLPEYLSDVSSVLAKAKFDIDKPTIEEISNDYYIIAEPALTSLKNASIGKKTLTYLNLTDPTLFNNVIPQAALFINKNSYNNKKDKIVSYINDLDNRINICINNPIEFKNTLDKYGDDALVNSRFGFKSQIAFNVQKDNRNGFAIYPSTSNFTFNDMNDFMRKIDQQPIYDGSEFL